MQLLAMVFLLILGQVQADHPRIHCEKAGVYANPNDVSCGTYIKCGEFGELLACQNSTVFDPGTKQCSTSYICSHKPLQCSKPGNQIHPNDKTCKQYLNCTPIFQTFMIKINVCPENTTFDPDLLKCSSTHTCPTEDTCQEQGKFPIENDTTCTKYYECSELQGRFIKSFYSCPQRSYFDPETGICTTNYNCVNGTLTSKNNPEIVTIIAEERKIEEINCTGLSFGPHPNVLDEECREYFYCLKLKNETYEITKFSCRNGFVYNPDKVICSWSYICPYKTSTNQVISESFSAGKFLNLVESTTKSSTTSSQDESAVTTTELFSKISTEIFPINQAEFSTQSIVTTDNINVASDCTESMESTTNYKTSIESIATTENQVEVTKDLSTGFPINNQEFIITTDNVSENTKTATTESTAESTANTKQTEISKKTITTEIMKETAKDFLTEFAELTTNKQTQSSAKYIATTVNPGEITDSPANTKQTETFAQSTEHLFEVITIQNTDYSEISTTDQPLTRNIVSTDDSTTIEIATNADSGLTTCGRRGYFKDPRDDRCNSFVFCDVLSDGSLYPYRLSCPGAFNFDPRSNLCSSSYQC